MTNKQEWVGTTGLKQLLLMLVGFIYLLWQWQVMQRIKGFSYRNKQQMNRCCPNAVKESRSERVGLYRNEQGGFACLALLKITLSLHQCQRSHHRYSVYRGGTTPANTEETWSMQCTIWCMLWHGNMNAFWANAPKTRLNEVGLNPRFNFKLHMWIFKCPLYDLC